jgi:hypothetical protein
MLCSVYCVFIVPSVTSKAAEAVEEASAEE